MKKTAKLTSLVILSSGMFVIAISQVVFQYVNLSDFSKGSLIGLGLGLLILGLRNLFFKPLKK